MKMTHFRISIAKSVLRIWAGVSLVTAPGQWALVLGGVFLILAEILGIVEEIYADV